MARRPVRKVPIPPELVGLLRAHIQTFGVAPDGQLFRSENGTPAPALHLVAGLAEGPRRLLTSRRLASPLMKRPTTCGTPGITWRLNSGVPASEVAAWAGHSVETLMRVYVHCITGMEDVWISRMD